MNREMMSESVREPVDAVCDLISDLVKLTKGNVVSDLGVVFVQTLKCLRRCKMSEAKAQEVAGRFAFLPDFFRSRGNSAIAIIARHTLLNLKRRRDRTPTLAVATENEDPTPDLQTLS